MTAGQDVRTDVKADVKTDVKVDVPADVPVDVPTGVDVPGPTCTDRVLNGTETGVDCGGSCPGCPVGTNCGVAADCQTADVLGRQVHRAQLHRTASRTATETDVDCGGGCPPCYQGKTCLAYTDCVSYVCSAGVCSTPTCTDMVKNQGETDTDCGGSACSEVRRRQDVREQQRLHRRSLRQGPLLVVPDTIKNGDEVDVDCGGALCATCADGKICRVDTDCLNAAASGGVCISCVDKLQNGGETDVDCGGATTCAKCTDGKHCAAATDCAGNRCTAGTCTSCTDGKMNADETDVDCGGTMCTVVRQRQALRRDHRLRQPDLRRQRLRRGQLHRHGAERQRVRRRLRRHRLQALRRWARSAGSEPTATPASARRGRCAAPSCTDGVKNQGETDVDCGGTHRLPALRRLQDLRGADGLRDQRLHDGLLRDDRLPVVRDDRAATSAASGRCRSRTLPCEDIRTTGTRQRRSATTATLTLTLPFSFNFFGVARTSVLISASGALSFNATNPSITNSCLDDQLPTPMIAVFWEHLHPSSGRRLHPDLRHGAEPALRRAVERRRLRERRDAARRARRAEGRARATSTSATSTRSRAAPPTTGHRRDVRHLERHRDVGCSTAATPRRSAPACC